MWRLNVRRVYLNTVFDVGKFFVNRRFNIQDGELLLLNLVKKDDPRHLGRVRGVLEFDGIVEDKGDESVELYGRKWRYAILARRSVRLQPRDWFDLDDVLGIYARRYYGQVEAMRLDHDDAVAVERALARYIKHIKQ
ncbi:MAG: hypothetical protein RMJ59_07195 [Candidatus Nitrosocaldus sp.]|nr:hypothetical protein [Candidatus Nitrosocaldus sp.]MDW8276144.1 hypothetical protein [Candidatus Nitrosocaldus sp.]